MTIQPVTVDNIEALTGFFGSLSERDLTFVREDLSDTAAVSALAGDPLRWVDIDDERVDGYVAVERLPGWSSHVGELRLVVDPARRGSGLGRGLAQHALTEAFKTGIRKVVVELAVDQEGAVAMFSRLGFTGEALLRDHIRDRDGHLHDLLVLAHNVDENWSTIDGVGLSDALMS
ncbi:GNAT family N-acetyltransferase [Skermania sp. ID1734]|uniref:GNAT family N-acetyltransferase n=1 Tax=Skermania sp. ID1734 TaxID=2597516 RepID=UPI001180632D|nr:GNAT family N-acetyltransferase [Skermania sp. ID1734]TSD99194.1 GNAT family N-acetyltransferase [Skermania sp. ID1734]